MKAKRVPAPSAADVFSLAVVLDLPREMHCCHDAQDEGVASVSDANDCPDCHRVREVMEALRSERQS